MKSALGSELLWVDACGTEKCAPGHRYGPAVRSYYLIHYIFSGQGEFFVGDQRFTLNAGQGFVIFPGVVTTYRADDAHPWHYGWLGFSGKEAHRLTQQAGFTQEHPVFTAGDPDEILSIISSAEQDVAQLPMGSLSAAGGLLRFLSRIAHPADEVNADTSPSEDYFHKASWYIEGNLENNITVTEVAAFVGLCRSQLFRVFQTEAGCGPQEWILKTRMRRAERLLRESSLTLDEVARSCGFAGAAQLGQSFRRYHGYSPTHYRKISAGRMVSGPDCY